jgi:hypothetical protein
MRSMCMAGEMDFQGLLTGLFIPERQWARAGKALQCMWNRKWNSRLPQVCTVVCKTRIQQALMSV